MSRIVSNSTGFRLLDSEVTHDPRRRAAQIGDVEVASPICQDRQPTGRPALVGDEGSIEVREEVDVIQRADTSGSRAVAPPIDASTCSEAGNPA
jgi:hypothetical protein